MSSTFPCPKCGEGSTSVIDSRAAAGSREAVRRRRRCQVCSYKFTTYEQMAEDGGGNFVAQVDALAKQAAAVLAQSEAMLRQTDDLQRLSAAWREIEEGRRGS